jgi:hypothetical protein
MLVRRVHLLTQRALGGAASGGRFGKQHRDNYLKLSHSSLHVVILIDDN